MEVSQATNGDENRVFYGLQARIGLHGKYQTWSSIIWFLLCVISGSMSYFLPFLLYQGTYECPNEYSGSCRDFVCAQPQAQRLSFMSISSPTMIQNHGSFLCQDEKSLNNIQSLVFSGLLLGNFISTGLLRIMRKKYILIICIFLMVLGLLLVLYSPGLMLTAFGAFLIEAFVGVPFELALCFVSETVDQQDAANATNYICLAFSLGMTINGPLFYLLDWQTVLWIFMLIPAIACLLAMVFFIEQTPFDMITNIPAEEIYASLMRVAGYNGITDHGLTVSKVEDIKNEYKLNQLNKNNGLQLSVLDLFKFPSLRKLVVLGFALHILLYYLFGAPELVLNKYSLSIFMNSSILGSAQILGSLVCILCIEVCPRRLTIFITSGLQVLVLAAVLYVAPCADTQCHIEQSWIQTGGLFVFRFLLAMGYNSFYILIYEVFPTQIRSQALMFCSISIGIAEMIIPLLVNLTDSKNVSIIWTFFFGSLCVLALVCGLPETLNSPSPDMIKELAYDRPICSKESRNPIINNNNFL